MDRPPARPGKRVRPGNLFRRPLPLRARPIARLPLEAGAAGVAGAHVAMTPSTAGMGAMVLPEAMPRRLRSPQDRPFLTHWLRRWEARAAGAESGVHPGKADPEESLGPLATGGKAAPEQLRLSPVTFLLERRRGQRRRVEWVASPATQDPKTQNIRAVQVGRPRHRLRLKPGESLSLRLQPTVGLAERNMGRWPRSSLGRAPVDEGKPLRARSAVTPGQVRPQRPGVARLASTAHGLASSHPMGREVALR